MTKISIESREAKIKDRARQLYRDDNHGEDIPVPDHYLRHAEHLLITEGAIQPKAIPVGKLISQTDA